MILAWINTAHNVTLVILNISICSYFLTYLPIRVIASRKTVHRINNPALIPMLHYLYQLLLILDYSQMGNLLTLINTNRLLEKIYISYYLTLIFM